MPTSTYTPLANITLASNTSTITFSSIAQTPYKDLVLIIKGGTVAGVPLLRPNNLTTGIYGITSMGSNSGAAKSNSANLGDNTLYFSRSYNPSNDLNNSFLFNFMDFSATDKEKMVLAKGVHSSNSQNAITHRVATTSAITSLVIYASGGNSWLSGTTMALYGIQA